MALAAGVANRRARMAVAGSPYSEAGAEVGAARFCRARFAINVFALVMNLLPVRMLDGGQLLAAARLWRARNG